MKQHPTRGQLEELFFGQLPDSEVEAVFAHLETGCPFCEERLAPLVAELVEPEPERVPEAPDYGPAFEQAASVVRERWRSLQSARARVRLRVPALRESRDAGALEACAPSAQDPLDAWACCEALLECCREQRHRDPRRMLFFARAAQIRSRFLDAGLYGRCPVADLQALTWAELANAYRVTDSLGEAEEAMQEAFQQLDAGSGDVLLLARILDLSASLDRDCRRIARASGKLEHAYQIFVELGEDQLAGRTLVQKSLCLMHQQRTDEALATLKSALELIDPVSDLKLALAAAHNLVRLLMEKGEYRLARQELFRRRGLYMEAGDPLNLIKLRWLEAQIDAGLGKLPRAEQGLLEVRESFRDLGKHYYTALVGLELAAVWVRQGKPELVPRLAEEIVTVFRSLGIAREAIAAVLVLHQAHEQGILSLHVVQKVSRYIEELERDPAARFEP